MNPLYQWLGGAVLALVLGGCGPLLDGPTDIETAQAVSEDLRDAQAAALHAALAAQQAAHPERWTAEQRVRADVAVRVIARGVKP